MPIHVRRRRLDGQSMPTREAGRWNRMKRIFSMFRAFWAFLDRNLAIERQKRIADEVASIQPKPLKMRDHRKN